MEKIDTTPDLLEEAFRCKPDDLESMLERIELAIKDSELMDKSLLRAKTVVTCKLVGCHSK